jgi:phospholipid-binding lipoprotein MlaA
MLPASACVTYPDGWEPSREGGDPYEGSNRKVFAFNEGVDKYFMDPLAIGWEFITFQGLRNSVDNFFVNLTFPRRFLANLGQGEFEQAGAEAGRFLLNTTVGLAGIFDPASRVGMKLYDEDFGQMFGHWGIGPGPYWVLPILGPSNPRDTVGLAFDLLFDVRTVTAAFPVFTLAWTGVLQNVNRRALLDDDIDRARDAALDFYIFTRDAYSQRREALIQNEATGDSLYETEPDPVEDDLYEIDTGDEPGDVSAGPPAPAARARDWAPPASVTVHPGPGQDWHPPEGDWFDVPAANALPPTRSQSPSDATS